MDQTQLVRHMLICKKEVASIKGSIGDGFKRIEGWIKTIVPFGVGTVTVGLGTVLLRISPTRLLVITKHRSLSTRAGLTGSRGAVWAARGGRQGELITFIAR